jgi:hypothetical protein
MVTTGLGVYGGGAIERRLSAFAGTRLLDASPTAVGHYGAGALDLFTEGTSRVIDRIRK